MFVKSSLILSHVLYDISGFPQVCHLFVTFERATGHCLVFLWTYQIIVIHVHICTKCIAVIAAFLKVDRQSGRSQSQKMKALG